ncbi:hypothetical protein Ae168Ps1_6202 [Pseudonocardia sp. Ae168_Ps1]|nr:hypothetical protein Ae168Ps1_6202 [Pseudonocardia sp. Ae168_Ps1]OLL71574.1 hypothetical protein Ae263Ps1_6062 [Pseudonocardia sp. Ae263_Ps1]
MTAGPSASRGSGSDHRPRCTPGSGPVLGGGREGGVGFRWSAGHLFARPRKVRAQLVELRPRSPSVQRLGLVATPDEKVADSSGGRPTR